MPGLVVKNWSETTPPSAEEIASQFAAAVEKEAEAPPMLIVWVGDDSISLPVPGDPITALRAMVEVSEKGVLPRPTWIVFASEAWTTISEDKNDLVSTERGELESRKRIGMTGVEEGFLAHMQHRDGRSWHVFQSFKRLPMFGTTRWGTRKVEELDHPIVQEKTNIPNYLPRIVGAT